MTALMEQCIAEKEIHYKVGTIATGDLFMQGERQKRNFISDLMRSRQRWKVAALVMFAI